MKSEDLTPLQRELNALRPGETHEHSARIKEFREKARFLRVNALGEALSHHPFWVNTPQAGETPVRTPRPRLAHLPDLPFVSLSVLEPPVFSFDGTEREFGHLYRFGWAMLVAEPLLECILELDSYSIEFVPATIIDREAGNERRDLPKCFLVMPLRALDCIDLDRSSVKLSFLAPLPDITKPMRKCTFEEYVVRADIPKGVHIFSNVFNGEVLFSVELIRTAIDAGVWGIWARRTEKGHSEQSMSLYGDRQQPI